MTKIEQKLYERILHEVGDLYEVTPSLVVEAYVKGRRRIHLEAGDKYALYDLASLTKPIFTVSMLMSLVDEKKINLNDRIKKHLPWWPHSSTRIREVLSHSAGLPWWAPFYKKFKSDQSFDERREVVRRYLSRVKLARGQLVRGRLTGQRRAKNRALYGAVYSDLDFILLGFVIEAITGRTLVENWLALSRRLKLKSIHFVPLRKGSARPKFVKSAYAPTEKCPWRKKTLRGEVHDDNTWAMGGVSTHAGLFGSIRDVAKWGLLLRQAYYNKGGSRLCSHQTARLFCRRALPVRRGDWALGLMMPSRGGSSAGRHFSPKSVGHTGFTGTSLWFDPQRDLLVVILSNRVHPTRDNVKFRNLRPRLHDFIVEISEGL